MFPTHSEQMKVWNGVDSQVLQDNNSTKSLNELSKENEVVSFPVTFYLDPLILEDPEASRTKNVTLSYTFFEKKE